MNDHPGADGSVNGEAMQAINREVFRWILITLFLGMAAGSVVIAVFSWFWVDGPVSTLIIIAALVLVRLFWLSKTSTQPA